MIERDFLGAKIKEYRIQDFIASTLKNVGHSHTKVQKTPLGEKIIIFTSRPGLVVGRKGQNISKLTKALKRRFDLDNPQIEISEIQDPNLDAQIVAERIASFLERFGSKRFKGVLHKTMEEVLASGALGVEIVLAGKVPSSRAKTWRVYAGYLKKSGDLAVTVVRRAQASAKLKTGIVGIKVAIMPDVPLPDTVELLDTITIEEGQAASLPAIAAEAGKEGAAEAAAPEEPKGLSKKEGKKPKQGAKAEKKPRKAVPVAPAPEAVAEPAAEEPEEEPDEDTEASEE